MEHKQYFLIILLGVDKESRNDDLEDIKNEIYRFDETKKKMIKEFIRWYSNQKI